MVRSDWAIAVIPLSAYECAAAKGHLNILQYAKECGEDLGRYPNIWTEAAMHGHFHILDWALDQKMFTVSRGPNTLAIVAAEAGKMGVFEWMHKNGMTFGADEANEAAAAGHLPIVQFIVAHSDVTPEHASAWEVAHESGHAHICEWIDLHHPYDHQPPPFL